MTKDYKNNLKVVDNLKNKAILNNTNQDWCDYRKMRNRCENYKKKLKMQSNMDYVNNSGNQTKTAWRIMNREIGKQTSNGTIKKLSIV
jgi:hypothetical protein